MIEKMFGTYKDRTKKAATNADQSGEVSDPN